MFRNSAHVVLRLARLPEIEREDEVPREARESEVPIIRERVIMTFGCFREKDPLSISIVCHNQYDFSIFWPQIARGRSIIIVVTVLLEIARERSLAKTLRN